MKWGIERWGGRKETQTHTVLIIIKIQSPTTIIIN